MKRFYFIAAMLLLVGCITLISCKKEDSEPTPVDNTPVLTFMTGTDYVSVDITLEVNTIFKVGVLGSKNPNTNIDLAIFKVTRTSNGNTDIVHENNAVDGPNLSWENTQSTQSQIGEESWTFTLQDYTGQIQTISLVITTVEEGTFSPSINFIENENYIYENTSCPVDSVFQVGIIAFSNPNTLEHLSNFKIIRTLNNTTTTVFEESNIENDSYTWEGDLTANSNIGGEEWSFTISDIEGNTEEISFIINTYQPIYNPAFSPTYLIVTQGQMEFLDFYLTCTTDDWEMVKIVVSYPGGLGSEVYAGNGQITTAYTPFTFSNYFPMLTGTWTFSILGYIKSGSHVNESFTTTVSIVVS